MSWLSRTTKNGSLAKTIASKFKRLNFFHGMLLTEDDFQEEQTYFREKIKLHNRLHGYGVVWGLSLKRHRKTKKECASDAEKEETFVPMVTIEAGFALDCNGNEILVCNDYEVLLEEEIKELERKGRAGECESETPPRLYIGVRYCECRTEPAEQYTTSCYDDELHPQYSRIREGFCVVVLTEDAVPECSDPPGKAVDDCHCLKPSYHCPGSRACADEHTVILGYVLIQGDIREITDDKIRPNVGGASPMSYRRWEEAKRQVIQTACCRDASWYDVSFVIGQTFETARSILKEDLGIQASQKKISELSVEHLARVKVAQPCYQEGSYVDLITEDTEDNDGSEARVLFAVHAER